MQIFPTFVSSGHKRQHSCWRTFLKVCFAQRFRARKRVGFSSRFFFFGGLFPSSISYLLPRSALTRFPSPPLPFLLHAGPPSITTWLSSSPPFSYAAVIMRAGERKGGCGKKRNPFTLPSSSSLRRRGEGRDCLRTHGACLLCEQGGGDGEGLGARDQPG